MHDQINNYYTDKNLPFKNPNFEVNTVPIILYKIMT